MRATVVQKLCRGCGNCVRACPENAIFLVGGKAVVNPVLCTGCERCLEGCMQGAIAFVAADRAAGTGR